MLKAIFFDFGGVVTESPFEAFSSLEKERGLPVNFIREINSTNPHENAWAQLERGEISPEQFDVIFANEASSRGHQISGKAVLQRVFTPIRGDMVELIQQYAAKFKLACLTNNFPITDSLIELMGNHRYEEWQSALKLFEYVIESAKLGVRKPETQFFSEACRITQVEPDEVIFLDDIGSNLKPAREMGMTTIKVTSSRQAIDDLREAVALHATPN